MLNNHRQYTLPIIQTPDFTEFSYFVSDSNASAYQLIENWGEWPFQMCAIFGPEGYGKTHLGHILRDRTNGVLVPAQEITEQFVASSIEKSQVYIIDDVDLNTSPKLLFHMYNLALENKSFVVFLLSQPPASWDSGLADLNSRLRSLQVFELLQPDDAMCRAIIKKIFSDFQLSVKEEVVDYFQDHTSRNLGEIQKNIKNINVASMELRRNITIPFIKQVLNVTG